MDRIRVAIGLRLMLILLAVVTAAPTAATSSRVTTA
ncbi:MAG: hypothetical protein QOG01_455 [Pseudonocardiales bacterium]|jgi:hypothetical protein|nr:hypothetical protein [Pseudonocardiales bacterium]